MKRHLLLLLFLIPLGTLLAQTNLTVTNAVADQVIKGNFDPLQFSSTNTVSDHQQMIQYLQNSIEPDSLKAYIVKMATFHNRNTGSDTLSTTTGIGAARRWAYGKFEQFSSASENRLIPSYFQFDQTICSVTQHRNIIAVLPGSDVQDHEVIIIEGHIDSRCESSCDITCQAHGIEDNASGSALVLELARVMSTFSYPKTIVFMLTIGEEQGLYGANAFALYCQTNTIPVKAVLNNDVIGGIICGNTSSAPSCPGVDDIDSTQVRIFSYGGFNSPHKQLARFTKLQYKEELLPYVNVPMLISIMTPEDRSGRSGDHVPFRQKSFTSCRFTSANEHGNASNGAGYVDRQHTTNDILGVDTNADLEIDSFFVDFNYLARNAAINGTAAIVAAKGPKQPDFSVATLAGPTIIIEITDQTQYANYRVGLRTLTNDWDSVYTINGILDTIYPPQASNYIVSVASVDEFGMESLFSKEINISDAQLSTEELSMNLDFPIQLLQNKPNPFDEATIIGVYVNGTFTYKKAWIQIEDEMGKELERIPITLHAEINEIQYEHGYGKTGTFIYSLIVDDIRIDSKRMVFAN
ncbi:MAG: M28 family peptidase [Bacteroidetes bacterium]|nr:MAG: M28 family peptidase [Bacteroidota bacterium]